jgi:predicted DNA binding protein
MSEGPTRVPVEEVLATFRRGGDPRAPLTAPEVAEELGCARRTAHAKLETLAERGDLRTKKVGARGRVWWPAPADGADGEAVAPDRRAEHERALRELHDASRRLIRAETREEVCEVAVDAAWRILGLPLNGLWLYDAERDLLEPAAWTDQGAAQFGEPPAFPVDASLVGRAFREGTHRVYADVTAEAEPYDPDTRVRSELVLPLSEYGVMNAASLDVGAFDELDVSLGRVLAANVETAIERADRLAERRAHRRELERQRDELERLNRINALVEEIVRALVGAATRPEIERTVCETLGSSSFYAGARVVERGSDPGSVVSRVETTNGTDVDPAGEADDAARSALEDGGLQVVPRLGSVGGDPGSCLVTPLSYADTVFGALVVRAPAAEAFGERETVAFETLGRVVGFVINATNNRRLLLGQTAVEVEFTIGSADTWFATLSERLGCTVTVDGVVPVEGGSLLEYVTVEGIPTGTVREALAAASSVETVRVLADGDDRCFIECSVSGTGVGLRTVAERGASLRTVRAVDGSGTITARFPSETSARETVSAVEARLDDATLVAKRIVDLSDRSTPTPRRQVLDRLTDRQRTTLRAAFLAGYYDYPRGTTAEDLAASLDIAPSTLHQHLQAAQRKVLAGLLDES